jgi:hypothetical protein
LDSHEQKKDWKVFGTQIGHGPCSLDELTVSLSRAFPGPRDAAHTVHVLLMAQGVGCHGTSGNQQYE